MKKRVHFSWLLALLLALSMAVMPCAYASPTEQSTDGAVAGGEMIFATTDVLGEFFTPYKQGSLIAYGWPTYEPLAKRLTLTDGELWEPCLAESWERDDEACTLTIHLVQNATFSDGTPFTSADVVFSLGSRADYGTESVIGSPVSIEAPDDYTVVVTWGEFSLNYEQWVLSQFMFSKKAFDDNGLDWMLNNMMGTGPYVLSDFVTDSSLTFTRNENYWDAEAHPAYPDSIKFLYMSDATSMLAAFMNGEVDRMNCSDPIVAAQLDGAGFAAVELLDAAEAQYLAVPLSIEPDDPLYKPEVRRAIFEHGIDWNAMATGLGGSLGYHTDAIGMSHMTYYDESVEASSFDPELAKQELADAGYPDGFTTTIYTSAPFSAAATVLQDGLAKLGITAECEFVDYSLVQSDYIGAKATTTGICITCLFFPSVPQVDRFTKHINPNATYGASSTWSEEIYPLWDAVRLARTQEEEDAALLDYVKSYVHDGSNLWPMYNTKNLVYNQEWAHFTEKSLCNGSIDPCEIWTTR